MRRKDAEKDQRELLRRLDKNFTGRAKELRDLAERMDSCGSQPVWYVHGIGGVGKSELLKFFLSECQQTSRPCAYVDLGSSYSVSESGLLYEIADQLGLSEFWAFREIYDRLDALQRAQTTLTDTVKSAVTTAKLAASPTPAGGLVDFLGDRLSAGMKRKDAEFLLNSSELLFQAFTTDLSRYLARRGRVTPVLLLFDTYEKASGTQIELIRYLVVACRAECPAALFVIAGRDEPKWEGFDEGLIASQPLDGLPGDEAEAYLWKRGITDQALVHRILRFTGRFPMFLRMACDIVDSIRAAGGTPTADEFPKEDLDERKVTEFLLGRIIERFPKEHRENLGKAIKVLGISRWFDEHILAALTGREATDVGGDWEALTRTSLLQPAARAGYCRLYDPIRDAVASWWKDPAEVLPYHKTLAEWHGARRPDDFNHLREWLYHLSACEPLEAVRRWRDLCEAAHKAVRMAQYAALLADASEYPISYESMSPKDAGEAHFTVGWAFARYPNRFAAMVDEAIRQFRKALGVYTEKDFPREWAATQNNLGTAYWNRPTGDRGENLRRAIECYEAALTVHTERDFPQDWAAAQNNLGIVYQNLPTGDRAENLRRAIACCEAALRVYTEEGFPPDWAWTQNNLGTAYWNLPTGDRGENLRKAIACYEAALTVHTEKDFPQDWATTQNNLGIAHADLPAGDRGENLGRAIECYQAALTVRTEKDFPQEWAMTQNNLGNAYQDLRTGDRGENLRRAIACYEAALTVRTEKDFPQEWALTQNNLGLAHADLPTGDRGENLREAIECYEAALTVRIEKGSPQDWALTMYNFGLARTRLSLRGGGREELSAARNCFLDAARGFRAVGNEPEATGAEQAAALVGVILAGEKHVKPDD